MGVDSGNIDVSHVQGGSKKVVILNEYVNKTEKIGGT